MKVRQVLFVVGLMLMSVFALTAVQGIPASFAVGPTIVQTLRGANTTTVLNQYTGPSFSLTAGDQVLIGGTMELRSGSAGTLQITLNGPGSPTCQTPITNNGQGGATEISMAICGVNGVTGGSGYTINIFSTGNTCGSGSPCGFIGYAALEFSGHNIIYTNTSGTNHGTNGGSGAISGNTNTISYPQKGGSVRFGISGIDAINTNQTGADHCFIAGSSGAAFNCDRTTTDPNAGSYNFPITSASSGSTITWSDEGIVATLNCDVVITSTSTNFTSTVTVTTTKFIDLAVDYSNLWIIFLIFVVLAIVVFYVIRDVKSATGAGKAE